MCNFFLEKLRTLFLESISSQWCSNFSPQELDRPSGL